MHAVKIALIGAMGAGKTSVGLALAKLLQLKFIDLDQYIEQQCNLSVREIFKLHGEAYFRQLEASCIKQALAYDNIVLATGGGSILNADLNSLVQQHCTVCYLQVSVEQQIIRLQDDQQRPLLPIEPLRADFLHNLAMQRNFIYAELADIILHTDHISIATVANKLQQELAAYAHNQCANIHS